MAGMFVTEVARYIAEADRHRALSPTSPLRLNANSAAVSAADGVAAAVASRPSW